MACRWRELECIHQPPGARLEELTRLWPGFDRGQPEMISPTSSILEASAVPQRLDDTPALLFTGCEIRKTFVVYP